jgi:hypothetical protein
MIARMSAALSIYDETLGAGRQPRFTLHLASERVTAREIIERRVREEVREYNRHRNEYFFGLVRPTDAEQLLNGYRMRAARPIDENEQCARALEAFERNGFVLLVNDRQVELLDESIDLGERTDVTFLKLVPLVGG